VSDRDPLAFIQRELAQLEQADRLRTERPLAGGDRLRPVLSGKPVVSFCGNDYLGLATHPALREAAAAGAAEAGAGSTASRLVCGTLEAHALLEADVAAFVGTEAAAVFSTGYMANVGTLSALAGRDDVILADRLAHASLLDGAKLSDARLVRFRHNDVDHLLALLGKHAGARRRLVVTEGVYSMEGDVCPLPAIVEAARQHGAILVLDDAHAFGVLGEGGRGTREHHGVPADSVDVVVGTFGKAMGSFGAFVAGRRELIGYLKNRARSYIYTTALPPSVVAVNRRALERVQDAKSLRTQLARFAEQVRASVRQAGMDVSDDPTPIVPVVLGRDRRALQVAEALLGRGFLVQAIRPPTVPEGTARLRVTVSAGHRQEEVDAFMTALTDVAVSCPTEA